MKNAKVEIKNGEVFVGQVNFGNVCLKSRTNAALFAAAPSLLEELKELVGYMRRYHNTLDAGGYLDAAESAIDQAEGRQ